jgi:hypothetical protein
MPTDTLPCGESATHSALLLEQEFEADIPKNGAGGGIQSKQGEFLAGPIVASDTRNNPLIPLT